MRKRLLSILLVVAMLVSVISAGLGTVTAGAAALNTGAESLKVFSATGTSVTDCGTSLRNTLTIRSTNSSYQIRVKSISATTCFQQGDYADGSANVSYTAGAVVGTGGASYSVTGTLVDAGATAIIRYTVGYDILDASGNTLWTNLTGYGYGAACGANAWTGVIGSNWGRPGAPSYHSWDWFNEINSCYVDAYTGTLNYKAYTSSGYHSSYDCTMDLAGNVPGNMSISAPHWNSTGTSNSTREGTWCNQTYAMPGYYEFSITPRFAGANATWNVQQYYNPNQDAALAFLNSELAKCYQKDCYSNFNDYLFALDRVAAVAYAVHRPNWGYRIASWYSTLYQDNVNNCANALAQHTSHAYNTKYHSASTTPATCTAAGGTTYTCICGSQSTTTIPAKGHTAGNVVRTTQPTCTSYGVDTTYCSVCGQAMSTAQVPMLAHSYDSGTVTKAPTCTETGVKTFKCVNCDATYTESIPAKGHSYTSTVTPPTCTAAGYTTYTCSVCGDSYKVDGEAASGHTPGEWQVMMAPTCSATGAAVQYCTVCGSLCGSKILDKLEHNYEVTVTDPTCTEDGKTTYTCKDCGDVKTEVIPATGHTHGDWEVVTEATCTAEGLKVKKCTVCGEVLESEAIPATGHSYEAVVTDPTCTEAGYTTYTCKVCGDSYVADEVDALGHTPGDWEIAVEAVEGNAGTKVIKCTVCGEVLESEEYFNMVTVTFAGCDEEAQTMVYGNKVAQPANPAKDGYVFKGWYVDGAKYDFETPVTADITITAEFVEKKAVEAGRLSTTSTAIAGITPELYDGRIKLAYTDVVDWAGISQNPNEELGGNKDTVYVGFFITAPEGAAYATSNNAVSSMSGLDYKDGVGGWYTYPSVARMVDGVLTPWAIPEGKVGVYGFYNTYYWYDENQELIAVDTLFIELCEYKEATVTFVDGEKTTDVKVLSGNTVAALDIESTKACCEAYWALNGEAYDFDTAVTENIELTVAFTDPTHSYEAVVTDPTCTEAGYTTYTCSVCGDSYVADEVEALGHTAGDWEVVTPATCTAEGLQVKKCTVCGETLESEAIPALGHSYEAVVTAPTCTEAGYTTYTCAECGDSYVADEVDALGHTPGDWEIAEVDGKQVNVKKCTVCGVIVEIGEETAADYSAVEAAVAEAEKLDGILYVNYSTVEAAIAAVDYTLKASEQATVDGYAAAINEAVAGLIKVVDDIYAFNTSGIRQVGNTIYVDGKINTANVSFRNTGSKSGYAISVEKTGTPITQLSNGRYYLAATKCEFGEEVNGKASAEVATTMEINGVTYNLVIAISKSILKAENVRTIRAYETVVDNEAKTITIDTNTDADYMVFYKGTAGFDFTMEVDESKGITHPYTYRYYITKIGSTKQVVTPIKVNNDEYTLTVNFVESPFAPKKYMQAVYGGITLGTLVEGETAQDAVVVTMSAGKTYVGLKTAGINGASLDIAYEGVAGLTKVKTSAGVEFIKAVPQDEELSDIVTSIKVTLANGNVVEYPLIFRFEDLTVSMNAIATVNMEVAKNVYDESAGTMTFYGSSTTFTRIRKLMTNGLELSIDESKYSFITYNEAMGFYEITCPFNKTATFEISFNDPAATKVTATVLYQGYNTTPVAVDKLHTGRGLAKLVDGALTFEISAGKANIWVYEDLTNGETLSIDADAYSFVTYADGMYTITSKGIGETVTFTVSGNEYTATITRAE